MGRNEDTPAEDIGRPAPWGQDRYLQPGQSAGDSVRTPPASVPNADKRPSTTVTRKDYELPGTASTPSKDKEPPGGDAG